MKMIVQILFFLCASSLNVSCKTEKSNEVLTQKFPSSDISKADTVKQLGNNIMLVYQDIKNNYWFGSWKEGLYRYDGKTILHFSTKSGLPSDRIEEIKEDHLGNLFFNTDHGVCRFDGHNFTLLKVVDTNGQWMLQPNDLWFKQGWDSKSIYRYDGAVLHSLVLPKTNIGEAYIRKYPKYSNPYSVYCIYQDSKKHLWFGTATLGVFRYNGQTFDWISEDDVTELHHGPANGVRSVIEDEDGYFWFNTAYRYFITESSATNSVFYRREQSIGSLDKKKDGRMLEYLSITKDKENSLWIATYKDGVYRIKDNKIKHFPISDGASTIALFTIYADNEGNLWLGTHENGAYQFNGHNFVRFKL